MTLDPLYGDHLVYMYNQAKEESDVFGLERVTESEVKPEDDK